MYTLFMALRYLRAHRIIYFSIAGVAVGIMVMIAVTSVMGGFSRDIKARLRGVQSHITVRSAARNYFFTNHDELCAAIRRIPHVTGCAPRIEYPAWLTAKTTGRTFEVQLLGLDPTQEEGTGDFRKYFERFETPFAFAETWTTTPAVVGSEVIEGIRKPEDVKWILGWQLSALTAIPGEFFSPRSGPFDVVGAFKSGHGEYDSKLILLPLEGMQKFLRAVPDERPYANLLAVGVDDYERHGGASRAAIVETIHARVPCSAPERHHEGRCGRYVVLTWEESQQTLLQAVAVERGIQGIILFFMIIVAGFNIIAIYTLMVRAKTRDVGILRSLGATTPGIIFIFLLSGVFCGLVGCLIGIGLGILIATNLNEILDFIRIGSRELNRLSHGTGWTTLIIPLTLALFLAATTALIASWVRVYRPWKGKYWITSLATSVFLGAGVAVFFLWLPEYVPQLEHDWPIPAWLGVALPVIVGLTPLVWSGLRILLDPVYDTFGGSAFRILSTFVYSVLILVTSFGILLPLALLAHDPPPSFPGYELFPQSIYYLDRIPEHIDPGSILIIVLATLVVSLVFSIYPALRAARTDALEAMRDE